MLPDRRAYFLVLTPVTISAVQLLARFYALDMNMAMLLDLCCVSLASLGFNRFITRGFLLVVTGVSVVQAVLISGFYDPNLLRFIHHVALYILFPFFLAQAYVRYDTSVFVKMGTLSALYLAAMNFIVIPIELILRGGIVMLHTLNFSGRSYEIISILLLATALAAVGVCRANGLLNFALLATTFFSFSRGALAITLVVFTSTWRRQFMQLINVRNMLTFLLLSIGVIIFFSASDFEYFHTFWWKRLNLDNTAFLSSIQESFFSIGMRPDIWLMGLRHITEWPYLGTGIATTAFHIAEATNGFYAFSGYHNLSITLLAERGIFIGVLFLWLLLFILIRLGLSRNWQALVYFGAFLLFAHTTGTELVLHSSGARNANILFFLFLLYMRVRYVKKLRHV